MPLQRCFLSFSATSVGFLFLLMFFIKQSYEIPVDHILSADQENAIKKKHLAFYYHSHTDFSPQDEKTLNTTRQNTKDQANNRIERIIACIVLTNYSRVVAA